MFAPTSELTEDNDAARDLFPREQKNLQKILKGGDAMHA
jgi:hypothetical protein